MKKLLFSLLSILMLIFLLSGCTPQQEKVGSYLEKAELTEEEINILKLAEAQEPLLFDFTVNTGKSFTIQTFELQDGQWVASQGYSSSRITFRSMDALPSGRMKKPAHSF